MFEDIDEALRERLKATLWYHTGLLVDAESLRLGTNATPQFIGALTELVWSQIEGVAEDLQSFARHAGRSTVSTADVLLLARRNEALEGVVREFVEGERAREEVQKRGKGKGKGRARGA